VVFYHIYPIQLHYKLFFIYVNPRSARIVLYISFIFTVALLLVKE